MKKPSQRSLTTFVLIVMTVIASVALYVNWGKLVPAVPADSAPSAALPLHVGGTHESLHAELMKAAWHALDEKEYDEAIEHARRCIEKFKVDAEEIQLRLERLEEEESSTAPTPNEIFSRGPLNDVAASYFIIGEASQALGDIGPAMEAYRQASRYTYALVWDERGWFWSPAKEATGDVGRNAPDLVEILDPIP